MADKVIAAWPGMRVSARENRKFLGRAVQYLAGEAGIDQFLDIGSGLPTASNVHEVAQAINPAARVVYVDNDPLVLVHARALLTSSPEGKCAYIQADLREPEKILSAPATQGDAGLHPADRADPRGHRPLPAAGGRARADHQDAGGRAAVGQLRGRLPWQ